MRPPPPRPEEEGSALDLETAGEAANAALDLGAWKARATGIVTRKGRDLRPGERSE